MTWLFPGQRAECPLTQPTVSRICQQARAASKLTKPVSPHTLRHCFASGRANGAIMLGAPTSGYRIEKRGARSKTHNAAAWPSAQERIVDDRL